MKYKRHFFVCVTNRPPFAKPSCGPRGSPQLLQAMTEELDAAGLIDEIGLTGSTCLGPCDSGPSMVVYPEGVWYQGVKVEDVAEIVRSHAKEGKPVERLLYTWPSS